MAVDWLMKAPAGTSVDERRDIGRQARRRYPRSAIADWTPPADRPSATELLTEQESSRIPELVPVRHARMGASALAFYRGSAVVMASDLGRGANSGLQTMLCGDAHLSNFGVFGSAEHSVVFDVNDFDETAPGPFEWDVMRLVASFVLVVDDRQLGADLGRQAAAAAAGGYRERLQQAAGSTLLSNWYAKFSPEDLLEYSQRIGGEKEKRESSKVLAKSMGQIKARDAWSAVRKLTEVGPDGRRRFRNQPPLLVRLTEQALGVDFREVFGHYLDSLAEEKASLLSSFEVLDVAHKVVGVGSVGLPATVVLLEGPRSDDFLVIQLKAAQASVLERWTAPAPFDQHGQRVVVGQRSMQASGDPFLGWLVASNRGIHLYARQLRDFKWSVDLEGLSPRRLLRYARLCGATLAMAHSRIGDPIMLAEYVGKGDKFDRAMVRFSETYAALAKQDYAEFVDATADSVANLADSSELTAEQLAAYRMPAEAPADA